MTDRITLTGVRIHAHHGVFDFERARGQDFIIDITVWKDIESGNDELSSTINYAELADLAIEIGTGPTRNLIETVAAEISDTVLARYRAVAVETTVHKPQAPLGVPFTNVSATVRRSAPRTGAS